MTAMECQGGRVDLELFSSLLLVFRQRRKQGAVVKGGAPCGHKTQLSASKGDGILLTCSHVLFFLLFLYFCFFLSFYVVCHFSVHSVDSP